MQHHATCEHLYIHVHTSWCCFLPLAFSLPLLLFFNSCPLSLFFSIFLLLLSQTQMALRTHKQTKPNYALFLKLRRRMSLTCPACSTDWDNISKYIHIFLWSWWSTLGDLVWSPAAKSFSNSGYSDSLPYHFSPRGGSLPTTWIWSNFDRYRMLIVDGQSLTTHGDFPSCPEECSGLSSAGSCKSRYSPSV